MTHLIEAIQQQDPVAIIEAYATEVDPSTETAWALENLSPNNLSSVSGLTVHLVYSGGGYEGGGEHVERTYKLSHTSFKEDLYVRTTGSYYSNDGIYWSGHFARVYPKQVMQTIYTEIAP